MYYYNFPAVKGVQANNEYYIAMIPCGVLKKLFIVDDGEALPEFRAQRKLNISRVPEIANYILNNRNTYVFSALAASIDGAFSFEDYGNGVGLLKISMNSRFLINDGQHRNAAIQQAILEDSSLEDETIPVVFFSDQGLKRSQQMFTDLNKYAIKPSKSQNTFYDHKDPLSMLSKKIVMNNNFLKNYTDVENDTLGKYSAKLFTLNSFYNANKIIVGNGKIDDDMEQFCFSFWQSISDNIPEWKMLENKTITKKSLREEYIITQNVVLYAFGKLGNFFYRNKIKISDYLDKLSKINWLRTDDNWNNITIFDGKIKVTSQSINLTYIKIKELIGIDLICSEKKLIEGR